MGPMLAPWTLLSGMLLYAAQQSQGQSTDIDISWTHLPLDKMAATSTGDIFRPIFVNEKFCILIETSMNFVPNGPIDNNSALF